MHFREGFLCENVKKELYMFFCILCGVEGFKAKGKHQRISKLVGHQPSWLVRESQKWNHVHVQINSSDRLRLWCSQSDLVSPICLGLIPAITSFEWQLLDAQQVRFQCLYKNEETQANVLKCLVLLYILLHIWYTLAFNSSSSKACSVLMEMSTL